MKLVLSFFLVIGASSPALAGKAALCKQISEKMAIAFFQVNRPDDRILSLESVLTDMQTGAEEDSDEGLARETWEVSIKAVTPEGDEMNWPDIEVELKVSGQCRVSNVSVPTLD